MLTVDTVVPFLLGHGLIDPRWVIDGELTVRSAARRNRNLRVEGPAGIGYLLKQPDDPIQGGWGTLRCEAAFLQLCWEDPALGPVARLVPRLHSTDLKECILVFELIAGAVPLRSRLENPERVGATIAAMRSLGRALATVHRTFRRIVEQDDPRLRWLSLSPPWGIGLHRPSVAQVTQLSPAGLAVLRILQTQEGIRDRLHRLSGHWQTPTLIHGDVKFENVLVPLAPPGDEPDSPEVWIADWEMVQFGDPAWDLAGALQDLLVLWVSSMPLSGDLRVSELAARARLPMAGFKNAARALWTGYRDNAELEAKEADRFLLRAVELSAARLAQSAFEGTDGIDRLPGWSAILLQITANLLAQPERGQIELYGIPLG
jgi:hypothetical protein